MSDENRPLPAPGSDSNPKVDLKPLLAPDADDATFSKHRSLEKTDRDLSRKVGPAGLPPREAPPAPPARDGSLTDVDLLKEELSRKTRECSALEGAVDELNRNVETLRNDFYGQTSDRLLEIRTLKDVLQKTQSEAGSLAAEISDLKQTQKRLKAQNLSLQYHLNAWGIPVISGEDGRTDEERLLSETSAFFPAVTPVPGGPDPVPVTLRGDLSSFFFPNLLHFLANANLCGVVTVVTDGIVAKLYLEKAILLLAGWNNTDRELSLATLLAESQLVPTETLAGVEAGNLYDLELASILVQQKQVPPPTVQSGLKEHARVILSFLYQLKRGVFFFQPGRIPRKRDLQFRLAVTDLLLKTAAEMDEKTRDLSELGKLTLEGA